MIYAEDSQIEFRIATDQMIIRERNTWAALFRRADAKSCNACTLSAFCRFGLKAKLEFELALLGDDEGAHGAGAHSPAFRTETVEFLFEKLWISEFGNVHHMVLFHGQDDLLGLRSPGRRQDHE